jgi:autotransporter-associated beta strand protein
VQAATVTWDGEAATTSGDYNWSTATNWDTDTVPANGDDVVFPTGITGGSFYQIDVAETPANLSLNSVEINDGGYVLNRLNTNSGVTVNTAFIVDNNTSNPASIGIEIAGTGQFINNGTGTAYLYNPNSYTGVTRINDGIVSVADTNALGNGNSDVIVGAGGNLDVQDVDLANSIELNGASPALGGQATLTLNGGSESSPRLITGGVDFAGSLYSVVNVLASSYYQLNINSLTETAIMSTSDDSFLDTIINDTSTGTKNISLSSGHFRLNTGNNVEGVQVTFNASQASSVELNAGLDSFETANNGTTYDVYVNDNPASSFGAAPGFAFINNLTLSNSTNLHFYIEGTDFSNHDVISDVQNLSIDNPNLIIESTISSLNEGDELRLFRIDPGATVTGTFANFAEGDNVSLLGSNAQFTYSGGDGNDIAIEYPAQQNAIETQNIYRIYSPERRAHAYISKAERDQVLATDPAWTSDLNGEPAFKVVTYDSATESCSDASADPVYRYYSNKFSRHFYTIDAGEKASVDENPDWDVYDGIVFCAYTRDFADQTGYSEVYRFWNEIEGGHFYTASTYEYDQVRQNDPSWRYEQIGFAVPE